MGEGFSSRLELFEEEKGDKIWYYQSFLRAFLFLFLFYFYFCFFLIIIIFFFQQKKKKKKKKFGAKSVLEAKFLGTHVLTWVTINGYRQKSSWNWQVGSLQNNNSHMGGPGLPVTLKKKNNNNNNNNKNKLDSNNSFMRSPFLIC